MENQQVGNNENIKKQAGTVQQNPTRFNRAGLSGDQRADAQTGTENSDTDSGINAFEGREPNEFENDDTGAGGDAPLSQGSNNRGVSGGAGGVQFGQGANKPDQQNVGGQAQSSGVAGGNEAVEKKSEGTLIGQTHAGRSGFGTSGTSGTNSGGQQGYGSGIGQAGSQNGSTGYNAGSQGMPQKMNEGKEQKGSRSDNAGSNKGTMDNSLRDLQ